MSEARARFLPPHRSGMFASRESMASMMRATMSAACGLLVLGYEIYLLLPCLLGARLACTVDTADAAFVCVDYCSRLLAGVCSCGGWPDHDQTTGKLMLGVLL